MAYKYDVFVSYRRTDTIGRWARNHFVPRLEARISENSAIPISVFCDFKLEEGGNWAAELRNDLRDSKLLLPVWSADYFRSRWCMAEWKSFLDREENLGLRSEAQPQGLIYPVRYADGEFYPEEAKATQCTRDFSELSYPDEVFRQSPRWLDFDDLVRKVAVDLIARLTDVPAWQDFPVTEPPPLADFTMPRPRL